MKRSEALPYVSIVLDDALSVLSVKTTEEISPKARLVGWQCGFEPMVVAVQSYLDVRLDTEEAAEIAKDYLEEKGWFSDEPTEPDFVI